MTHIVTQADIQRLASIYLPKWPQMLVWSKAVTVEQAKDIILRTDRFFTDVTNFPDGSNRKWIDWAQTERGFRHLAIASGRDSFARQTDAQEELHKGLNTVQTTYAHNSWASSSFVHGPYGWCPPDGTLWFEHNVGKDPCAREVFEEWQALATAFPFLGLTVTLMSGARLDDDKTPLVSFRVVEGAMHLLADPAVPDVRPVPSFNEARRFATHEEELAAGNGLDDQWIRDYGKTTRALLTRFL